MPSTDYSIDGMLITALVPESNTYPGQESLF